tara:strand:- start:181 stop:384 length:204 start_codon:yes stop_codon:yes gene_type:complete
MKLSEFDFYLDWPVSIKTIDLRRFIISKIIGKGLLIRWAIVDIKASLDSSNIKKIRINAVIANPINP